MGTLIDLTGQKYGRLTVLYKTNLRKNGSVVWHCKCECGNECDVSSSSLRTGSTKSCGCLKKESDRQPKGNVKDELGHKYGHLTVIARAGSDKTGQAMWLCECDCENHSQIIVLGNNLRKGHTQSCGCDRRSHGELKVEQILRENNISFVQEYRAFKFASGRWATFDFYINNQYLIEYDGETHYQSNLHGWHTKENLATQLERDIIKDKWCKENNIPLIRIPYTQLNKLCIDDLKLETTHFLVNG